MRAHNPTTVLFLCTGNSARSIMAEALLNRLGQPNFHAYSAGSHPKGQVHPETIRLLRSLGYSVGTLRSKSWDEFAKPGGVRVNQIITVCNNAAGEICPVVPGNPSKLHWDIPDPAAVDGNPVAVAAAFRTAYEMLETRIIAFIAREK